jgi:hypothetical protein
MSTPDPASPSAHAGLSRGDVVGYAVDKVGGQEARDAALGYAASLPPEQRAAYQARLNATDIPTVHGALAELDRMHRTAKRSALAALMHRARGGDPMATAEINAISLAEIEALR